MNGNLMEGVISIVKMKPLKNSKIDSKLFSELYKWGKYKPGDLLVTIMISDRDDQSDLWTKELPMEIASNKYSSIPNIIPLEMAEDICDVKSFPIYLDEKLVYLSPAVSFELDLEEIKNL